MQSCNCRAGYRGTVRPGIAIAFCGIDNFLPPRSIPMLASTVNRVPANTPHQVNRDIERQTKERLARYAEADPAQIEERLRELDREWDIERMLETNASAAVLAGVFLGATLDRRWFALPAVVGGFLLQHALQGWCPPLP